jgi:hypothetical protein
MLVGNYGVTGGAYKQSLPNTPISLVSESWVIEVTESSPQSRLVLNQIPDLESYDGLWDVCRCTGWHCAFPLKRTLLGASCN